MTLNPLLANKPVHELEMSVRLANIMRDTNIVTIGAFMNVKDRDWFLNQDRAGVKSWKELCSLQDGLNGVGTEFDSVHRLKALAIGWNQLVTEMSQRGEINHGAKLQSKMNDSGIISMWSEV